MLAVLFVAFVAVCVTGSGVPAKSGEIVTTAAYQGLLQKSVIDYNEGLAINEWLC